MITNKPFVGWWIYTGESNEDRRIYFCSWGLLPGGGYIPGYRRRKGVIKRFIMDVISDWWRSGRRL